MGVLAIRGSKAWLFGSAALALCLTAASGAVLHLAFPPTYEARALVLLEPDEAPVAALPGGGPDRGGPDRGGSETQQAPSRQEAPSPEPASFSFARTLDALFTSPREPSSRSPRGAVGSRLLGGGRLAEISATARDAEAAAAIANDAAEAFVAEADAASRSSLSTARARARAAAAITAAAPHPLDTPLLQALRRALSAMERRRSEAPGPFAIIGEAEMSARHQIAREVSAIRRRAGENLERALSRVAAAGRSGAEGPARVLVVPASPAEAVRRASPASERDALAGSALALLFGLLALLAFGFLVTRSLAARSPRRRRELAPRTVAL
jgi:hypothetical protein